MPTLDPFAARLAAGSDQSLDLDQEPWDEELETVQPAGIADLPVWDEHEPLHVWGWPPRPEGIDGAGTDRR